MIHSRVVKSLALECRDPGRRPTHVSAASGLVQVGRQVYVVADDELHLGVFDMQGTQPGRLLRLFEGNLPRQHDARKAAKPDLEALAMLPSSALHPPGLLAVGSGSKPNRQAAAWLPLDAAGNPVGPAMGVDMAALYAPLRHRFTDLNIEGAFISDGQLCLLQRGNVRSLTNACICFDWPAVDQWLFAGGDVPQATGIQQHALGHLGGIPLGFTDGAALPGGGFVFSAAAEATGSSYADGECVGSVVGVVSASGELLRVEPVDVLCKIEGIAVTCIGDQLELLLVTDADDRRVAAALMSATLS